MTTTTTTSKVPRKILAENGPNCSGTQVLHLETGQEALVPYCACPPDPPGKKYQCHCWDNQNPSYAGMGPGYWFRVFRALKALGWDIKPEDFGSTIAHLIYNSSDLLVLDGKWDEWESRKAAKNQELWANYE